jgi:hypothetical protein
VAYLLKMSFDRETQAIGRFPRQIALPLGFAASIK